MDKQAHAEWDKKCLYKTARMAETINREYVEGRCVAVQFWGQAGEDETTLVDYYMVATTLEGLTDEWNKDRKLLVPAHKLKEFVL